MRYRDRKGQYRGDTIDMLTMYPEARCQVVRLLAEIDARGSPRPDTSQSPFAMQRSSILGPERDIQRSKPGVIRRGRIAVPDIAR